MNLQVLSMSVIRLADSSRVFIQAIIDNFSRLILACEVSSDYGGVNTSKLLVSACQKAKDFGITFAGLELFVDSGSENLNGVVDEQIRTQNIKRVVAQIDVVFSNSMIEAFFRRLKHNHLYQKSLTSIKTLRKHLDFYVIQQNEYIPHYAHHGAFPIEVYTSKVPVTLSTMSEQKITARKERIVENLSARCKLCPT